MAISLDLRKAHLSRLHGDIRAVYTWINNERALVLLAAHRARSPWFVICESSAWRYDDPRYLTTHAVKAAEVLGMDETRSTWMRVATIIHEGLPDLVRMPHAPPDDPGRVVGEMRLTADGEEIAGDEIRLQDEPIAYEAAHAGL